MTGDDRVKATQYGILRFTRGELGPLMYGAYHVHRCKCGKLTTGVGQSLCPTCAAENWKKMHD